MCAGTTVHLRRTRDVFRNVDAIRALCPEAIIQPSTGGAVGMSDLERLQSTEIEPTPEFATLDCGTCNFGGDEIFVNTDNTVMNFAKIMAERGIKPELEVFDKGMIDIALKADRKGLLVHPFIFDFVLGVQMSATVRDLVFMAGSVPPGSTWTATGLGKNAWTIAAAAICLGAMYAWALRTICIWKRAFWRRATERWWKKWQRWPACWAAPIATPAEAREIPAHRNAQRSVNKHNPEGYIFEKGEENYEKRSVFAFVDGVRLGPEPVFRMRTAGERKTTIRPVTAQKESRSRSSSATRTLIPALYP